MEFMMSSARLRVVCLAVCFLMEGYVSASQCSVPVDTDIVVTVVDSKATRYHSWGGVVLSPGLVYFLKTFVSQCDYSKVRLSIVAVSNTVRVLAPFTSNPNDLQLAIQNWRPEFLGARIFLALRSIRSSFKTDARSNAARIAIVVTPQQSNNYFSTVSESLLLRTDYVSIIGVGYSQYAPSSELSDMTGSGDRVFLTATDDNLVYSIYSVKQLICKLSRAFQDASTTVGISTSSVTTGTTTAAATTTTTTTTTTPSTTSATQTSQTNTATSAMTTPSSTMPATSTTPSTVAMTSTTSTILTSTTPAAQTTTDDITTKSLTTTTTTTTPTTTTTTTAVVTTEVEVTVTPATTTGDDETTQTAAATTDPDSTVTSAMTTLDDEETTTTAAMMELDSTVTSAVTVDDEDTTTPAMTVTPDMTTMDDAATTTDT